MAFEIFKETGTRTKEYISITDNKSFGLPRTFLNKQGITAGHSAVLLYDKETARIAIHFTDANPAPKFAIKVRIPNNTQGGLVAARSFFDLKNIDVTRYSGRYDNFDKVQLKELGIDKDGFAYVLTLRERASGETTERVEEAEKTEETKNEISF